jgi:uncharacterized damage-inducible protein DinB
MMKAVLSEIEMESQGTMRILERVPLDKLEWTPHPKSMSLGRLAWHIATLPANAARMLSEGVFDIGRARPAVVPDGANPPAGIYAASLAELRALLETFDDDTARKNFTMRRGDQVLREMPNIGMIRMILLNHSYHHRGQLSVYLRLLDVPVPALYGTSADENPFA